MVAHVSIPVFHTHSPCIERKDVYVQIRAGIAAGVAALLLCSGVALAWVALPQAVADARSSVTQLSNALPSPPNRQFPRKTANYDSMYAPNAETRSVEHMYAKPTSRRYGR